MDGIFMNCRAPRILIDVVFGFFFERATQKVENAIEASQPELSLERVFTPDMPWADVEGHIAELPFFRLVDQPSPFIGREYIGVVVGDENLPRDLFPKGVAVVFLVIGDEILFL